jgi:hypothetical protein
MAQYTCIHSHPGQHQLICVPHASFGIVDCADPGEGWGSGGGSSSSGGGGPAPPINPVEAVKRELGMQSNKLDPDVKDRVEAAIARLGYRVTVGQVG